MIINFVNFFKFLIYRLPNPKNPADSYFSTHLVLVVKQNEHSNLALPILIKKNSYNIHSLKINH